MPDERRRRLRVPFQIRGEVKVEADAWVVETLNISLKGMLCASHLPLPPGLPCQVRLDLGTEISLHLRGLIVRATGQEAAIDFTGMDGETFEHLRRLVEYNAAIPEEVAPEILTPAFPLFLTPAAPSLRKSPPVRPRRRSGPPG